MRAWSARGHLTGDEHAAIRRELQKMAAHADAAETDADAGDCTRYSAMQVERIYLEALAAWSPPAAPTRDPAAEALEAAALAIIDADA